MPRVMLRERPSHIRSFACFHRRSSPPRERADCRSQQLRRFDRRRPDGWFCRNSSLRFPAEFGILPFLGTHITDRLSHLDADGESGRMVRNGQADHHPAGRRRGTRSHLAGESAAMIQDKSLPKGDLLATVRLAGIQAAKRTAELIPLCHNIVLGQVDVQAARRSYRGDHSGDCNRRWEDRSGNGSIDSRGGSRADGCRHGEVDRSIDGNRPDPPALQDRRNPRPDTPRQNKAMSRDSPLPPSPPQS